MRFCIGIDLHGTLLDKEWKIKAELEQKLIQTLQHLKNFSKIYICSGNYLVFVNQYLSEEVRACFDGYILETGCVISDKKHEKAIVQNEVIKKIKDLEIFLKNKQHKEVKYFARRLATISMFTQHEGKGDDPKSFFEKIKKEIAESRWANDVYVTHSDVAVDIIPRCHNKFTGLFNIAKGLPTIGIADSLNDLHLLKDAEYGFIPGNASPILLYTLNNQGKQIYSLKNFNGQKGIYQSKCDHTQGVVEILQSLKEKL